MKEIVLLSLFGGIDGFAKGFIDAGYTIKKHYYSEIDKHASANCKYNFKKSIHLGTVTNVSGNGIERPNIITFGSPCQDFSLAGKRLGMEGQRSSLITEAIRIISECRPNIFIWENVKGAFSSNDGADFWGIIQAFTNIGGYRLEWQLLNTAWVLPQNRERIYLVGHLAGSSEPGVFPIGENGKIFSKSAKSGQGRKQAKHIGTTLRAGNMKATDTFISTPSIAGTLTGGGNSGGLHSDMTTICVNSNTKKGFETAKEGDSINLSNPNSKTRRGRVGKGVAQTLDTQSNQAVFCGAMRGRNPENSSDRTTGANTEQRLEPNSKVTTNTLTGVQKDNLIVSGTWRTHKDGNGFREVKDGNSPTIPARAREDGSGQSVVSIDNNIRRLTEIECERLQGFPDDWTKYGDYNGVVKEIPKTQRYKMCGNAVTVKVVELIASRIKL